MCWISVYSCNLQFLLENIAKSKRFLFRFRGYGLFCWIYGCRWFVCGTWVCIWIRRLHVFVSSNFFAFLDKKYCIEYSQELKGSTNCIDDFITKMWSYFTRNTWNKASKWCFNHSFNYSYFKGTFIQKYDNQSPQFSHIEKML